MRGRFAAGAEVGWSGDQAAAEMPGPDAVDDDAGGEGIFFAGDRLRELEPPGTIFERLAIWAGKNGEELAGDFVAFHGRVAALEDARIFLLRSILEDQCVGRCAGGRHVPAVDLAI